ncbi:MAG: DNA polymerase I, partial [Candidatus Uhrbacteria bacterium]|nr:DNA polymerase I [Candidatus Uhrbacteria bacterium]
MTKKPRLFILDANALLHRAWHALPPLMSPEGMVVNAVYGVLMVTLKLLNDEKPDVLVACWDTKAATFRHKVFKEYKAQREKQPDELYAQIPPLKQGLSLLGVDSVELDGYEADDLLGTIAVRAKKAGWEVVIVTGDRDALQLVQPGITVMAFKKGVTDTVLYDEAEVKRQYDLTPAQFLDYKTLRGDPSDNIPGVKGIGEKGATELLKNFQNLSGILKAAHEKKSDMKPRVRERLLEAEKDIPKIVELVKIVTDVPIDWKPHRQTQPMDQEAATEFLMKMGFKTLLKRIAGSASSHPEGSNPLLLPLRKGEMRKLKTDHEEIRLDRVDETRAAFEEMRKASPLLVHVARGAADSLFAQTVDGIILGVQKKFYLLPTHFLKAHRELSLAFGDILSDATIPKLAHDAKAQMAALELFGFTVAGWIFDTMLAAYLLSAGERNHDLPSIASRYASLQLLEGSSAVQQAEAIMSLHPILQKSLQDDGLESVFERFELPLIPILRDMEHHGILIDKPYLAELLQDMTTRRQTLEKKMMKLVGREFNPASPSQLAEVLFQDLKLASKGIKKGKTAFSTAASELEKLRGLHPIIELIEEHRELSKLLSTYVEVLPTLADARGRVHTTFNQAVTATGRLSSTEPNLQNIPARTEVGRQIRRAFIAEKGNVILSCDYSQIELRLVAALAKDEKMLAAFSRGEDIHAATAAAILGIPKDEVTKDQRRIAKAINFGLIFGQGPQGLSIAADISFVDAKKFIETYFEVYSGIKEYMEQTKALAHRLGYVETLFGRRRYIPEINSTVPVVRAAAERIAINMPIQGTAADLMKFAMIDIDRD